MKKLIFVALLLSSLCHFVSAQELPEVDEPAKPTTWAISFQVGGGLAFGDDSWDVFKDFKNANGTALSLSLAKEFTPVFSVRAKARYLKLYNRVNLEVLDAYRDKYPDFFPRDGFYGYNVLGLQAEAMLNLTNLIPRSSHWFNMYLLAGVGFNTVFGYDKHIDNWDGSYDGLIYKVDTRTDTMPTGSIGGMLDFRVAPELSLNLELLGTFTGDRLEGVVYEEPYDVYITYSIGATIHF